MKNRYKNSELGDSNIKKYSNPMEIIKKYFTIEDIELFIQYGYLDFQYKGTANINRLFFEQQDGYYYDMITDKFVNEMKKDLNNFKKMNEISKSHITFIKY